ncbi:3-dehydroquinate synthase [Macleaya cordata]|uniref:3-dehydroquinate synthase n=1 Tax=Macleaya cordata TaxID=56857 RepID=A0A200QVG3_MACCD|nr:3-dehydroquinate synthase [Macleaya cordata]
MNPTRTWLLANSRTEMGYASTTGTNGVLINANLAQLQANSHLTMCSASTVENQEQPKLVWIWTESKQVITAAILGSNYTRVATFSEISSPQQLEQLQPDDDDEAKNVVISDTCREYIAAFQGRQKTVFAVSKTPLRSINFLEALERGLGGVVLKVEDVQAVLELKDYLDRRNEVRNLLSLSKATVTRVQIAGMGDRMCVDLCSLMRPGEGLLIGSFARGLFLVHSECLESNYIDRRPFRVNAGGKTSYLSELQASKEVIVVDQRGWQRTAVVGRVKIEKRPIILVEAKQESDNQTFDSILLQNAETVGLAFPCQVPVHLFSKKWTYQNSNFGSLKVRDEIMLRVQGGARHTGIEIQEFIVEK